MRWSSALVVLSVLLLRCPAGWTEPLSTPQTPWQTHATGRLSTNRSWQMVMGYQFTPLVDGQVIALGGYFNGTKRVRLFDLTSGSTLATTTVTSANRWSYQTIQPVTVTAGKPYAVAVYLEGSGGSARRLLRPRLPQPCGDIRIEAAVHASTLFDPEARPLRARTSDMFGQADIQFMPSTDHQDSTPTITFTYPTDGQIIHMEGVLQ